VFCVLGVWGSRDEVGAGLSNGSRRQGIPCAGTSVRSADLCALPRSSKILQRFAVLAFAHYWLFATS